MEQFICDYIKVVILITLNLSWLRMPSAQHLVLLPEIPDQVRDDESWR